MTTTASDADSFAVRRATRADLLEVFRIEQQSFPQPWPFAAFERFLGQSGFLVATEAEVSAGRESDGETRSSSSVHPLADGQIVGDGDGVDATPDGSVAGYVVADTVPNHGQPLGHIKDIAVHPDQRGHGLGSTLLERALLVMATADASSVKLEVRETNETAIRLYRRHGFVHRRSVPRYYEDGESALIMVCDLS